MRQFNLAIIIIAVILSACSTVNRGSKDHLRIDTVPQGAKVTTSVIDKSQTKTRKNQYGRYQDKNAKTLYHSCKPTPCAIELPRHSEFVAKLEHPGYEPVEIFIRSSSLKGGSTSNAAANLATASGSGFALAGMVASMEALFTSVFTLGTQTVNTSGIASSGAAAGLGVGVGMIAIDMATGANKNLFPNPVVIELATEGTQTKKDPLVPLYWKMIEAEARSKAICRTRKKDKDPEQPSCAESNLISKQSKKAFQTLKREQLETFKASLKAARAEQKSKSAQ